jgi:hypothetical protein
MVKHNSRKQKLYRMKGCSTKKTRKNYLGGLGGKSVSDLNLAFPSNNVPTQPNPFLSFTGKGGACSSPLTALANSTLAYPQNVNGVNRAYPSTGPVPDGFNFLNVQGNQHGGFMKGGSCGCGIMKGGKRSRTKKAGCGSCGIPVVTGGGSHRIGCKCSTCRMKGGMHNFVRFNDHGVAYPNGLVGKPWTPAIGGWPGVDGVQGNNNYFAPNEYHTDISRDIINTGANPPFSIGGRRHRIKKSQRGGVMSNLLSQDFINLGRQFQYGVGSAYNALAGYAAPVNPLPWKGQLPNTPNLTTVKAASI